LTTVPPTPDLPRAPAVTPGHSELFALRTADGAPVVRVSLDPSFNGLFVEWCGYSTSAQLRELHLQLIPLIKASGLSKVLGDNRRHVMMTQDDREWYIRDWLPAAIATGLRYAAGNYPEQHFPRSTIASIPPLAPAGIAIRQFETLDEARAWLAAQPSAFNESV
jgi:hypothetical protein